MGNSICRPLVRGLHKGTSQRGSCYSYAHWQHSLLRSRRNSLHRIQRRGKHFGFVRFLLFGKCWPQHFRDPRLALKSKTNYKVQLRKENVAYLLLQLFDTLRALPVDTLVLHFGAHCLGNTHARAVIPILTHIATYHETIIMRLTTDAPQPKTKKLLVGLYFQVGILTCWDRRHPLEIQKPRDQYSDSCSASLFFWAPLIDGRAKVP